MTAPDPANGPSLPGPPAVGVSAHAVVRLNTVDPEALKASQHRLREFDRIHSAQPGYLGSLVVDLGDSRQLVVNLWSSREDADAALSTLGPEVGRTLVPLLTGPSVLIGAGPVLTADLRRLSHETATPRTDADPDTSGPADH